MTLSEAMFLLRRVSYKPGSRVLGRVGLQGELEIAITLLVTSVDNPRETITIQQSFFIDPHLLDLMRHENLLVRVQRALQEMELHERDEWLMFDGKRLVEPHPERVAA